MIHDNQKESNRKYQEKRRRQLGIATIEEKRLLMQQNFVRKSRDIHASKYDYSDVVYHNVYTKVNIHCLEHGMFAQTPNAHMRGQGCPECGQNNRTKKRNRKTTKEFIDEARQIHNSAYLYEKTKYINTTTKVVITCQSHGDFEQTPKAHLRGQGCPDCANESRALFYESKGESIIESWLKTNNIEYVKQKTFNELVDVMLLRYDFYLPVQNILIEYDGQQHYEFVPYFHGDIETYERQVYRDNLKTRYASQRNIKLLRIRYDVDVEQFLNNIFAT